MGIGRLQRSLGLILLAACSLMIGVAAEEEPNQEGEGLGWPRTIEHTKGDVVIYQPEIESHDGNKMRIRSAVSVTPKDSTEPIFGVVWANARIATDRDERTIDILDIDVTDVRFPNASDEKKRRFGTFLEEQVEGRELTISLDRVLASLAVAERERQIAEGLNTDPPVILYRNQPSVLVLIDGEPRYGNLDDGKIKKVANSPYTIVQLVKKKEFYLDGGLDWYEAEQVMGPWTVSTKVPKKIAALRPEEAALRAKEAAGDLENRKPPSVIIATEPTELIATDGKPEYASLAETELLFVSNTDNDLLMDVGSQTHYVVLAGRWYSSKSLDGPWSYVVSEKLPADFAKIPPSSPKGDVRVFVAGTDEANEALMDNRIPQTAAVKRGSAILAVSYDGSPEFKKIEGTEMEYAVNTSYSVLKIEGKYWVCNQAVWYVGDAPKGPWEVATYRPDEIDQLPPSNPHYNTKYVYVYESTPTVVYTGYTPGYVGSYTYGGCVVYGTGWHYPSWYGTYYYPHHATWGFNMSYNPWYGWGVGISWTNGPFTVSIGWGGGYGGYYPYHGMWGPGGPHYVPVIPGPGNPWYGGGYRPPGSRPGTGIPATKPGAKPGAGGAASTRPGGATAAARFGGVQDNIYKRPENKGRVADRSKTRPQPSVAKGRPNDVYAGHDGNVYRRGNDGSWSQRQGTGWNKNAGGQTKGLDQSYGSRQRGSTRAKGYGQNRAARGSYGGSMGRARSGGGRRR